MAGQKYPQVLLLGNGINRAFGENSWCNLLNELRDPDEKYDKGKKDQAGQSLPFPLQAIFISKDNVDERLKEIQRDPSRKNLLYGSLESPEQICMLQNILDIGFDHILTTNYSYELESAALKKFPLASDWAIKKSQGHTSDIKRAESKYLLHTYNEVSRNGIKNQIWHIHGEARKCNSIILGHYYYASLLFKYKELLDRKSRFVHPCTSPASDGSWPEIFIHSDVYILGFRFDPSEFDLWWLLNRRKIENGNGDSESGKTREILYYSPDHDDSNFRDKVGLLECLGVKFCSVGMDGKNTGSSKEEQNAFYREFYEKAIEDISRRVEKARR